MAKSAMIECPSCQHRVSTSAKACPSCGAVLRKSKRGFFGKLILLTFWGFNILMGLMVWSAVQGTVETSQGLSGGELVATVVGAGIGFALLITVWLVGAVILGLMALLTRPK